jgi:hypothetical protein
MGVTTVTRERAAIVWCPVTIDPMPEEMGFEESLRRRYRIGQPVPGTLARHRARVLAHAAKQAGPGPTDHADPDGEAEAPATVEPAPTAERGGLDWPMVLIAAVLMAVSVLWMAGRDHATAHATPAPCAAAEANADGYDAGC